MATTTIKKRKKCLKGFECGFTCIKQGLKCAEAKQKEAKDYLEALSKIIDEVSPEVSPEIAPVVENKPKKKPSPNRINFETTHEVKPEAKPEETQRDPRVHIIKTQEDFNKYLRVLMDSVGNTERYDGLVPIYVLRRKIGESLMRADFDKFLKGAQAEDLVQLQGGSVEDSAKDKIEDSIEGELSGITTFARVLKDAEDIMKPSDKDKEETKAVLDDPLPLDQLGGARAVHEKYLTQSKGKPLSKKDAMSYLQKILPTLDDEFHLDSLFNEDYIIRKTGGLLTPEVMKEAMHNLGYNRGEGNNGFSYRKDNN